MTAMLRGSPESKTLIPGCAVFYECLRTSPQDRKKNLIEKKSSDCCCSKTLLLVSFIIVQISLAIVILGPVFKESGLPLHSYISSLFSSSCLQGS